MMIESEDLTPAKTEQRIQLVENLLRNTVLAGFSAADCDAILDRFQDSIDELREDADNIAELEAA